MVETWHSASVEETWSLAAKFAERLRGGGSVALEGDLGAGKTCFAKGVIAQLCGVDREEIPSPTFTLVEEYLGTPPIYHVDLYRMDNPQAAEELAWDEILAPGSVALIEWPERSPRILPFCQFHLAFHHEGEQARRIQLTEKE